MTEKSPILTHLSDYDPKIHTIDTNERNKIIINEFAQYAHQNGQTLDELLRSIKRPKPKCSYTQYNPKHNVVNDLKNNNVID
jgi:hypothetical protein